ncbi:NYN domain-containing protein [Candidatus Daviesbacteria bacterium]|nr:NYN domain-containing protein [Candidatus Daviesbacteria bacterium]
MGYIVILKPTMELPDKTVKGNADAELVLHTMIQFGNYNKAIIVSGDGDFHCLVEYLEQQGKLLLILAPNRHYSGLLRKYNNYIVRVDLLRNSLEQKRTGIRGRSKP